MSARSQGEKPEIHPRVGGQTTFLRLLEADDKGAALADAVAAIGRGNDCAAAFAVDPKSFELVPGAPFAYWVSVRVRNAFFQHPALEGSHRSAKQGLASADDSRFLRLNWEYCEEREAMSACRFPFAKGGAHSHYYSQLHLGIDWKVRRQIESNVNAKGNVRSNIWMLKDTIATFYFRPGLTWPRRTNGLSVRVMPRGCIFADKGPAVFTEGDRAEDLLALLAIMNSSAFGLLVSVQLARTELAQSFEVGLIQQTPVPTLDDAARAALADLAGRAWSLKRRPDTANETSHAFSLPALLQVKGATFSERAAAWNAQWATWADALASIQREIDERCFALYGIASADRAAMGEAPAGDTTATDSDEAEVEAEEEDEDGNNPLGDPARLTAALLSWAVGVAMGRFDIRLATGNRPMPEEPEPFDPLPAVSPGMLDGPAPAGYPVPFPGHGVFVEDDRAEGDIVSRLQHVLSLALAGMEDGGVSELCALLQVANLRQYVALPANFFEYHLKLYSKSRRQAPIYWPLSTPSNSYTLWVYYHRLTGQTLYTCVNDFLDPKLKTVAEDTAALRSKPSRSGQEEKELERLTDFAAELKDFREELLRIAAFWKPNLNDGVQITAAPLWRLFQHKPWQKKLRETWEQLEAGDFDWAHLALSIWPGRVVRASHQDRSYAIAHALEATLWEEVEVEKKTKGGKAKKTTEWRPKELSESELDAIVEKVKAR